MDGWRGDSDHALVVAPIFQLPVGPSQIYAQAMTEGHGEEDFSAIAASAEARSSVKLSGG